MPIATPTIARSTPRLLPLLAAVLLALLLPAGDVAAHARLVTSDPPPGAALPAVPSAITLGFSEAVDPAFSAASLRDAGGAEHPIGQLTRSADGRSLAIPVVDAAALPPGTYTLVWRVLSAVDGHVTTGVLAFSAGTGQAPAVDGAAASARPPWWRVVIRWLWLLGITLAGGTLLFALLVVRRPLGTLPGTVRLALGGAALASVAALLAGYDLGPSTSAVSFFDPPSLGRYRQIVTSSTAGRWWLVSAIASLALLALLAIRRRHLGATAACAGLALAAVALLGFSAGGHAASTAPKWAGIATNWLHVAAVAAWIGALPSLWLALRHDGADDDAARLATRFSRLGLASVALIVVTGLVRASAHVGGPQNLTEDDYGVVLIAKHLLFAPILIAAGVNQLAVVPRLRRSDDAPHEERAALRRSARVFVAAELVCAVAVVAAAAALAELPPADGPLPVDVAATPLMIDQHASAGDLDVWLLAVLAGNATDRYSLTLSAPDGSHPAGIQRVIVESSTSVGGGTVGDRFDAEPLEGSPGTWVFPAVRLGLRGAWDLRVLVRRAGVEDAVASFAVATSAAGQPAPRLVVDAWRLPRGTLPAWSLGFLALFVLVGGVFALRRLRELQPFAAAILLTMTLLIAAGFAVQAYRLTIPVTAATGLANPIPADDASLARGAELYTRNCVLCHGPGGAGLQTEDPEHSHGSSADLTDRRTRGQRDGDLWHTISNGVPGSVMPAFDQALTENERWDLVNYLRALQNR